MLTQPLTHPTHNPSHPPHPPLLVEPHCQHCLAEGQVAYAAATAGVDDTQAAGRQERLVTCGGGEKVAR